MVDDVLEALRAVIELSASTFLVTDAAGSVSRLAASTHCAVPPNVGVPTTLDAICAPATAERLRELAARAIAGEPDGTAELVVGDGDERRIVVARARRFDETRAILVFVDVTAERRSAERTAAITRATSDAIYDWDLVSGRLTWNEGLSALFGHPREGIRDDITWWLENLHPDERPTVEKSLYDAIAGPHHTWTYEYRFRRVDGTWAWVVDRGSFLENEAGKKIRMIGSMIDASERKAIEQRLLLTERLASLGTLAAGVAHEINNPLTYVIASIREALALVASLDRAEAEATFARLESALHAAGHGAERVRLIVRDLRTFARPDDQPTHPVDVRAVLASTLEMAAAELRERARVLRTWGEVPSVVASEGRLGQVFLNLLLNAAHAIPEGSPRDHVIETIVSELVDGRVEIAIRDTGVGMTPEVLARVFDPFFTTKSVGEGVGLGLAICHGIVTSLGGEITAESAPGRGSTFRVRLPGTTGAPRYSRIPSSAPRAHLRGKVLVVDDEPNVARSLAMMLDEHDVTVEDSAEGALARLERGEPFDAIVTDLIMPGMSGIELLETLEGTNPALARRVAFVSGGAFTARARAFLERTTNPYLEKPFDEAQVRKVVARLVREAHRSR